jgi:tetratricopeptide (TPR) repeat protein
MSLKASACGIAVLLLMPVWAAAQDDKRPIFINGRAGEDPSVIDITEIDKQYPRAAVLEYQKGLELARKGEPQAAVERLEAAIKIDPNFFNAHNSLAIVYHRTKRYRDAEREYREAAKLNPRSVAPLVNLGSLFIEESRVDSIDQRKSMGLLNSALQSLNDAVAIQPTNGAAQYLIGSVYFATQFFEEAEMHFKKALEYSGGALVGSRLALADVYIRIQEWDNVVVQLDAYLDEMPFVANRGLIRSVRDEAAKKIEIANK